MSWYVIEFGQGNHPIFLVYSCNKCFLVSSDDKMLPWFLSQHPYQRPEHSFDCSCCNQCCLVSILVIFLGYCIHVLVMIRGFVQGWSVEGSISQISKKTYLAPLPYYKLRIPKIRLTHILYHHPTFFGSEGLAGFMIHISIKISQKISLLRASKVLYYITSSHHWSSYLFATFSL